MASNNIEYQRQNLADLEYMIDQYTTKYIVPIYNQAKDHALKKQKGEMDAFVDKITKESAKNPLLAYGYANVGFSNLAKDDAVRNPSNWTWSQKDTDTLIKEFQAKLNNNKKISSDIQLLATKFCLSEYGGEFMSSLNYEERKNLVNKFSNYILSRIRRYFVRHEVDLKIPSNRLSYFLQEGIKNNSIAGNILQGGNPVLDMYNVGAGVAHKLGAKDHTVADPNAPHKSAFDLEVESLYPEAARKKLRISKTMDFIGKNTVGFLADEIAFLPLSPLTGGAKGIKLAASAAKSYGGYMAFSLGAEGANMLLDGQQYSESDKDKQKRLMGLDGMSSQAEWSDAFGRIKNGYFLDDIEKFGLQNTGHDKRSLMEYNSFLENKVDLSDVNLKFRNWKDEFGHKAMKSTGGNVNKIKELIDNEYKSHWSLTFPDQQPKWEDTGLPEWNWRQHDANYLKRMSLWYLAQAKILREKGDITVRIKNPGDYSNKAIQGNDYTYNDLIKISYQYLHAAAEKQSEDLKGSLKGKSGEQLAADLLARSNNSYYSFHGEIRKTFAGIGIYQGDIGFTKSQARKKYLNDRYSAFQHSQFALRDYSQAIAFYNKGNMTEAKAYARSAMEHSYISTQKEVKERSSLRHNDSINEKAALLNAVGNNNRNVLAYVSSGLDAAGISYDNTAAVPSWMANMSAGQLRANAAFWYGEAVTLQRNGFSSCKYGNKSYDVDEVIQKAYDYAHACELQAKGQLKKAVRKNEGENKAGNIKVGTAQFANGEYRKTGGNIGKIRSLLDAELKENGDSETPRWNNTRSESWMSGMDAHRLKFMSLWYLGKAKEAKDNFSGKASIQGESYSYNELIKKSYQYLHAASDREYHSGRMKEHHGIWNGNTNKRVLAQNNTAGKFQVYVRKQLNSLGISYNQRAGIPKWMLSKSEHSCKTQASTFLQILQDNKNKGRDGIRIGKTYFTNAQIAQRVSDYANAARKIRDSKVVSSYQTLRQNYKSSYLKALGGRNGNAVGLLARHFSSNGLSFNASKGAPEWMSRLGKDSLRHNAAFYYGAAIAMKKTGLSSMKIGNETMTLQAVAQRAFDYAHACAGSSKGVNVPSRAQKQNQTQAQAQRQSTERSRTDGEGAEKAPQKHNRPRYDTQSTKTKSHNETEKDMPKKENRENIDNSSEAKQDNSTQKASPSPAPTPSQSSTNSNEEDNRFSYSNNESSLNMGNNPGGFLGMNNSGWGKYVSQLGMGGFSDVYHNLGYVLAMLPDLLIGVFTGQKGLSLKNNLLPLGMILAGLFTKKHPLIKLMLIGFGGASLLNNAGHRILGDDGKLRNQQPKEPVRYYKTYADEQLNPRMKDPVIRDNVMCVDIDGKPMVISISNYAIDAYNKKALPLNTLANAVLAKYDEQKQNMENNYSQQLSQQNKQDEKVSIK